MWLFWSGAKVLGDPMALSDDESIPFDDSVYYVEVAEREANAGELEGLSRFRRRRLTHLHTPAEWQSGFDRQMFAEGLILQLPADHDGRNTWLLNYGEKDEAAAARTRRGGRVVSGLPGGRPDEEEAGAGSLKTTGGRRPRSTGGLPSESLSHRVHGQGHQE